MTSLVVERSANGMRRMVGVRSSLVTRAPEASASSPRRKRSSDLRRGAMTLALYAEQDGGGFN
jgi:hypothetical protein